MNTSFGETLRAAREAKGLTTSQVAAQTRMLVQIVEEMENEDFHRIAAPIYGRGFVRLFAECVGLDPIPLVKEFMDIYEGRRAPIVRTREVPVQPEPKPVPAPEPPPVPQPEPPAPAPEPPPAPAPAPEPPPAPKTEPSPTVSEPPPLITPDLRQEPAPAPMPEPPPAPAAEQEPAPEPIPEPPPIVRGLDLFDAAAARAQPAPAAPTAPAAPKAQPPAANVADIFSDSPYLSTESMRDAEGPSAAERFRTGLSSVSHGVIESVRDMPRSFWRIAALTVVALVVIAFLAWGCVKLYQATSVAPTPPAQQHLDASNDAKGKDSKPAETAKPPAKATQQAAKAPDKPQPKAGKEASKPAGKPAKRPPLRSTGQKIPPLYAD